jgi:hypothetical protein
MAESPRHRLRPVDDVADEMAFLQRERGTDFFVFHDDNFLLPREDHSLERVRALGSALDARGVRSFATVVKARPNDISEPIAGAMRFELHLVRLFLGVESSTTQGVKTLHRGVAATAAVDALSVLERFGIYTCFNLLVFDPDATPEDLLANMDFMEAHGSHPSNFGRVELYAGTPLFARLASEKCVVGDYVESDYAQATPEMQRISELTIDAFRERNFSAHALANRLQSTRFDVEIARWFHGERSADDWLPRARSLSQRLAASSARGVRRLVEHVRGASQSPDPEVVEEVSAVLRSDEARIEAEASALEHEIQTAIGVDCEHAPSKGIPVPRRGGTARWQESSSCSVG